MLKVAFLFLTIANVHHEDLWRDFFAGHEQYYSITVHAKNTLSSDSYFKPYQMSTKVPSTWANTMRAQVALLEHALADPDNEKFVFISESTIPLVDFDTAYAHIMSHEKSIFYFQPNPHVNTNGGYAPNAQRNLVPIAADKQFKNAQWVILNRKHAELMVTDHFYLEVITQHPHDQEHYPSTFLLNNGLFNEIDPHDTTYVEWNKAGSGIPYNFCHLDKNDELSALLIAQKQGYLFARKITKDCDLSSLAPYLTYRKTRKTNTKGPFFESIDTAFKRLNIQRH